LLGSIITIALPLDVTNLWARGNCGGKMKKWGKWYGVVAGKRGLHAIIYLSRKTVVKASQLESILGKV